MGRKEVWLLLLVLLVFGVEGRGPDAEYYAYATLNHSTWGEVCRTETYEFVMTSELDASFFDTFNFQCFAEECKYLGAGEFCFIDVQSNHPLFKHNFHMGINDAGGNQWAQILNSSTSDDASIGWDLSGFCSAEGSLTMYLETNDEIEWLRPDGSTELYNPLWNDCIPGISCSATDPTENISDGVADDRHKWLTISLPGINVNFDGNSAHCDCFMGNSCNGQSCYNASFPFEAGTSGPCCGDDSFGGLEPYKNRENFNYRHCGDTWDPNDEVTGVCESNVSDVVCCNHVFDCVYDGVCYNDPFINPETTELVINGLNASCSEGVWCPQYFVWNSTIQKCEYRFNEVCYSNDPSIETDTCDYEFGTPEYFADYNDLESKDCFDQDLSPTQACCPFVDFEGALFYLYSTDSVVIY